MLLSPPGEDVTFHAFTPDSSARALHVGHSPLTACPPPARRPLASGSPTTSAPQPQIAISPDSVKVVFLPPSGDRLRVVPAAGPANAGRRLTDPFVPGGSAGGARISADSRSVVYRADQETLGVFELYRVPLTLTPAPDPPTSRLNGPLVAGGDVSEFLLSPSDTLAVYRADQDTDGVRELYRVRLGGAENVKLNPPLNPGWEVGLRASPTATGRPRSRPTAAGSCSRRRSTSPAGLSKLYSAPSGGPNGAAVRIDRALPGSTPRPTTSPAPTAAASSTRWPLAVHHPAHQRPDRRAGERGPRS